MNSETEWVASKLQCGLGNRLFQLAAAHKMSVEWSVPLVFAMSYCAPSEHGDFDTIFKLFPNVPKLWKAEAELSLEQSDPFEQVLLPHKPPASRTLLRGFWQLADYVLDSFIPSWDLVEGKDALLDKWKLTTDLQRSKTAFLHVRLGDYKLLRHHQVNLLGYFAQTLKSFPDDTRFLIFSDSPEEAAVLPVFNERCVIVDEKDEYKTLYLMSRCWAGAICANSTFSWWGAFFGRQAATTAGAPYKAYMPSKWFTISLNYKVILPTWASVVTIA
jgi:hypothetical protein